MFQLDPICQIIDNGIFCISFYYLLLLKCFIMILTSKELIYFLIDSTKILYYAPVIRNFKIMNNLARHQEILKVLSFLRHISVQELAERLNVSEVTIRKDLTVLEELGYVVRMRGGVQAAEDSRLLRTIEVRQQENLKLKQQICENAKRLIREGETIYLDAGSTCLQLAKTIVHMNLRVVTCSIDVMIELARAPEISLFTLGGSYRKESGSFIGPIPISTLENFNIETCFIGTSGFTTRGVFSSQNIFESQLKQKVLTVSKRRVILADSTKVEKEAFSVFARSDDVDVLVSDSNFKNIKELNGIGIEVLTG